MKFEEAYVYFGVGLKRNADFSKLFDCQSCDFYGEMLCLCEDAECYFCEAQDREHVKFAFFDSTFRSLDDLQGEGLRGKQKQ